MSCNSGEDVEKLQQQISVMRKELKNLRQRADGSVRSHRKHMTTLQSALSKIGENKLQVCVEPNVDHDLGLSLEKANAHIWKFKGGHWRDPPFNVKCNFPSHSEELEINDGGSIRTTPIGYINSCFAAKNGTPRQPTVCGPSRATLQIQQTVFNNPDHPLIGLDEYSHVWIIFLFHKNGHLSYKAKVRPPRLNGQRVGVYSTRSPHRPNALGLTLAKLEKVEGDTLHLTGVDMIVGTPVLDIKPYIPCYDCPHTRLDTAVKEGDLLSEDESDCQITSPSGPNTALVLDSEEASTTPCQVSPRSDGLGALGEMLSEVKDYLQQGESTKGGAAEESNHSELVGPEGDAGGRLHFGQESYSTIAGWIEQPPVSTLEVRFTSHAERELMEFLPSDSTVMDKPRFKFLKDSDEAAAAIKAVLSADPRSVYRRTRCQDRLFFFSMDTADITCWFGDGFAEVLRVQPILL